MPSKKLTPAKAARRALVVALRKKRKLDRDSDKKHRVDAVQATEKKTAALRKTTRATLALAGDALLATSKQRSADRQALRTVLSDGGAQRRDALFDALRKARLARRKKAIEDKQTRRAAFTKLVSEGPSSEDARSAEE